MDWRSEQHDTCIHHLAKICLALPRIYQFELPMEELLDHFKFIKDKAGDVSFKQLSVVKELPIKTFLGSCFTQDFIAILRLFDFKIDYPVGIDLAKRTNRHKNLKKHRSRMAFYRKKGRPRQFK